MGLPGGSADKESACRVGDLGSVPGLGRSPGEGKSTHPAFWPGDFQGLYSPWGRKESDTTERCSLHSLPIDVFQDLGPLLHSLLTDSHSLFCLLTLDPHHFSFWFYSRTLCPHCNKMVISRHYSAVYLSTAFLNKVIFLA